jgi:hypothetical protein
VRDIQERITDVLDSHLSMLTGGCECGYTDDLTWNEHAAAVIVAELGMCQDSGHFNILDDVLRTRWLTAWLPVEDED